MKSSIEVVAFIFFSLLGMAQNGSVLTQQKIADGTTNFTGVLGSGVNFGTGVAAIGDLNGDGITELAVGAYDVGGKGAVYILFMTATGAIDSFKTIGDGVGGFTGTLDNDDRFGYSVAALGDLDLDGVPDVAVSSELDDDGGNERGAVWIIYLNADGTAKSHAKISSTTQGSLLAAPSYGIGDLDRFGSEVTCIGDLDNDGMQDIAVSAIFDDDGGGNRGAVWIIFLNRNGSIKDFQKISDTQGGFTGTLANFTFWGSGVANIGDLDGDGIQDLLVGQELEDAGGTDKGSVWVLFMNRSGTVKGYKELRNGLTGTGLPSMGDNGYFGSACAGLGDIDGDNIPDVAVGANGTDGGRGAVYILMLNTNGTVKAYQKISYNTGGLTGPLDFNDFFGNSVVSLGDLNGDGKTDIAVGAAFDDDGGSDKGAVYILNLQGVATNCVNAAFTTPNNTVCQGDTITLTNTSFGLGNVTYQWKLNGTSISTANNLQYAFNTPGTYTLRLISSNDAPACVDSIETTITVNATRSQSFLFSLCEGQSRFWAGDWRSVAGTYYDTLVNSVGCDSIVEVIVNVIPASSFAVDVLDTTTICQGQNYFGQTQSGLFGGDTFFVANTCLLELHYLSVTPPSTSSSTQTICNGDSVFIGNAWRFAAGSFNDTLLSASNCDSIVTVALTVLPNATSTRNISICLGQSFFAGGAAQTTAGSYYDTLIAANGCDSVVTTILSIATYAQTTVAQTICFGDSYLGYIATGVYRDTFVTTNCDSIRILDLTVSNAIATSVTASICPGQSYFAGGANQTTAGTYYDTLSAANSCDSVVTTILTVGSYIRSNISQAICFGDTYLGYSATGVYNDTFPTSGCDSIRTLDLTVNAQNLTNLAQTICQGQRFEGYTLTGIYLDTFTAVNGCDSLRELNLTVTPLPTSTVLADVCDGETYFAGGANQSIAGTYYDTLPASGSGCDSVVVTQLSINPRPAVPMIVQNGATLSIDSTGITGTQWFLNVDNINGATNNTYVPTETGVYYVVVFNSFGCANLSDTLTVTVVGINDVVLSWSLQYHPNPTSGLLFLDVNGAHQSNWSLYNSLGQIIQVGSASNQSTTAIDLSMYADGMYFLKVQVGGEVITEKVLLAR